jgi:hypothetical protein
MVFILCDDPFYKEEAEKRLLPHQYFPNAAAPCPCNPKIQLLENISSKSKKQ